MPDKKLTDNEIVKALECCTSEDLTTLNCGHRPNQQPNCMHILYKSTLDLINRLQTKVDDLERNDLPRCKDALRQANEIGMELQAENETLKALNGRLVVLGDRFRAELKTAKAANERLEYQLEALCLTLRLTKAEAYENFAYDLKQIPREFVYKWEIENLLNEKAGEKTPLNDVKCIDCEYLELELPYAVCSKAHKGIVQPNDSCGKGKLKEKAGNDDNQR